MHIFCDWVQVWQLAELVKMGRENDERLALHDVLADGPRNRESFIGGSAAPQLVHEDQAVGSAAVQNVRGFLHFAQKCAGVRFDIITGANARKESIQKRDVGEGGWHERTTMRHDGDGSDGLQRGRLTTAVWPCENDGFGVDMVHIKCLNWDKM